MKPIRHSQWAVLALLMALTASIAASEDIKETYKDVTSIRMRMVSGDVVIEAVRGKKVTVEVRDSYDDDCFLAVLDQSGNKLYLEENFRYDRCYGKSTWTIKVPSSMDIVFTTASGDLSATGVKGDLEFRSASGHIVLKDVEGKVRVKGASSRIEISGSSGEFSISNASGRIRIRNVTGEIDVHSASGDISIKDSRASFDVSNASGDVEATNVAISDHSSFKSASGDVEVLLSEALTSDLDLTSASGDATLDYNGHQVSGTFEFRVSNRSGRIISPYPFDNEDEGSADDRWSRSRRNRTITKYFTRSDRKPRVLLRTGSGTVKLKK